jgi:hypothetical protein
LRDEYWPQGLDDWTDVFGRRLQTFLQAMIDCENATSVKEEERLSGPMRESWESGDFWIIYAARRSNAFDSIYWNKIDQRFFGQTGNVEDAWRERLDLLSGEEKDEMEKLVAKKVKEMESRVLAWDPDKYTLSHIDIAKIHAAKKAKKAEQGKEQRKVKKMTTNQRITRLKLMPLTQNRLTLRLSGWLENWQNLQLSWYVGINWSLGFRIVLDT